MAAGDPRGPVGCEEGGDLGDILRGAEPALLHRDEIAERDLGRRLEVGYEPGDHGGVGKAWADRVDSHAGRPHLHRRDPGELDQRRLRRAVGAEQRAAADRRRQASATRCRARPLEGRGGCPPAERGRCGLDRGARVGAVALGYVPDQVISHRAGGRLVLACPRGLPATAHEQVHDARWLRGRPPARVVVFPLGVQPGLLADGNLR